MKPAILAILLVALCVLHQDVWWWDDPTPVLGFMPVGLAWHVGLSLAAAVVWWVAVRICWPADLREGDASEEEGA